MKMYDKAHREKIKAGLACCKDISGCKYETRKDCPYRKTDLTCDRIKLMDDTREALEELERIVDNQDDMIKSAMIALGADCDNCEYR